MLLKFVCGWVSTSQFNQHGRNSLVLLPYENTSFSNIELTPLFCLNNKKSLAIPSIYSLTLPGKDGINIMLCLYYKGTALHIVPEMIMAQGSLIGFQNNLQKQNLAFQKKVFSLTKEEFHSCY